jgi:hypothetical protein
VTPQEQLDGFIDRFTPEIAATVRRALAIVRQRAARQRARRR